MSKQLEYFCQSCDSRWYRVTDEKFNLGRECRGCHRNIFPTWMNVPIPPVPVNPLASIATPVVGGAWTKPLLPTQTTKPAEAVAKSTSVRGQKNPQRKATRGSSQKSGTSSPSTQGSDAGSSEVLVVETASSASVSSSPKMEELSESTVTAEASQTLSLEDDKNSFSEEAKKEPIVKSKASETKKSAPKSRRRNNQVWNADSTPWPVEQPTLMRQQEPIKPEVGADRFFRFFALNSDYGPGIAGAIAATREEAIERIIAKYFGNVAIHSMRNLQIAQNSLHGVDPAMSQRNLIGAPLDSLDGWEEQQQTSTDLIQVAAHLKQALLTAPYTEDPIKDCAFYMAGPSKTTITRYCQQ